MQQITHAAARMSIKVKMCVSIVTACYACANMSHKPNVLRQVQQPTSLASPSFSCMRSAWVRYLAVCFAELFVVHCHKSVAIDLAIYLHYVAEIL